MDVAKYMSFLGTLIWAPFFFAIGLIKIGFANILSILLLSILIWKYLSVNYLSSFSISFLFFSGIGLILRYIKTLYDKYYLVLSSDNVRMIRNFES